jgi:hypothetical protein
MLLFAVGLYCSRARFNRCTIAHAAHHAARARDAPVAFRSRCRGHRVFSGHSVIISASRGLRLALACCQLPITRSVCAGGTLRALVGAHGPAFWNFCGQTHRHTIKRPGTIPVVTHFQGYFVVVTYSDPLKELKGAWACRGSPLRNKGF